MVAEHRQPARVSDDDIEFVAMQDEQALAVGCHVHALAYDFDPAEMRAGIIAQSLVVITGYVDEPGTFAHLAHQLLQHVVVSLRPDRSALHAPEVHDIADQVDGVCVVVLQEFQQLVGLRGARSQMDVRNEDRAMPRDVARCLIGLASQYIQHIGLQSVDNAADKDGVTCQACDSWETLNDHVGGYPAALPETCDRNRPKL